MIRHLSAAALLTLGTATAAFADYPERPVTMVVGWNAGGGTDLVTRFIADAVSERTGAEIVVENRPGAGAAIASEQVANADPDGYTLMMATADSHTIAPLLRSNLGYDGYEAFTPIYLAATLTFSMVTRPGLEAEGPEAVIAAAGEGDGLTVGTWGVGSTAHIAAEMFNQATGVELVHVPYQGSAPAINDLQNDQIDIMFLGPGTVTQNIEDGTMKFVGAASPDRIGMAPDLPTFAEQGVDGVEMRTWFGLAGPAGLPDEVVSWWDEQMDALMQDQAFLDLLRARGMDPAGLDSEGFAAFMDEQSAMLDQVIDAAGITVE
ncbi:tripartite tricarboxylate transporter substrate binding protein [Jannaschia sp. LMIT008]|uniref:Bug family tripartite tricarboxylate transporter substrate binding protein n=1 Tax=Jannaschia maritima TaxID=3032585 RepID=UPI00281156CF|nr:tripartite tricarboxylate transporter substrate binding protein [Jannaschia sp. LMIT008]